MASRNSSAAGGLEYDRVLDRVVGAVHSVLGSGRVQDEIPVLADADPHVFGLAVATVEGEVHGVGEWRRRFSIQSISKVFTLALAIEQDGEALWTRVGREPSGTSFNSLVQLEYERGIPRNPFVNAGALVITDLLCSHYINAETTVVQLLRRLSSNPTIDYNSQVARSELDHAHRNMAIAHLIKSFSNLKNQVDTVIE